MCQWLLSRNHHQLRDQLNRASFLAAIMGLDSQGPFHVCLFKSWLTSMKRSRSLGFRVQMMNCYLQNSLFMLSLSILLIMYFPFIQSKSFKLMLLNFSIEMVGKISSSALVTLQLQNNRNLKGNKVNILIQQRTEKVWVIYPTNYDSTLITLFIHFWKATAWDINKWREDGNTQYEASF